MDVVVVDGLRGAVHLQRACRGGQEVSQHVLGPGQEVAVRLTSLKNFGDASVVGLQLHLELGQFLVQFAQVTVHLRNTTNSGQ